MKIWLILHRMMTFWTTQLLQNDEDAPYLGFRTSVIPERPEGMLVGMIKESKLNSRQNRQ